ncbi:MAG: hypothetical protein HQK49_18815 [Oligoflexia bacterium]|nr:hypothetical protein [Oligoflexia bacterium]
MKKIINVINAIYLPVIFTLSTLLLSLSFSFTSHAFEITPTIVLSHNSSGAKATAIISNTFTTPIICSAKMNAYALNGEVVTEELSGIYLFPNDNYEFNAHLYRYDFPSGAGRVFSKANCQVECKWSKWY